MTSLFETESFNLLGLHEKALETIERNLVAREDKITLNQAITTALFNRRYELAARYADRLKWAEGTTKNDLQIVSLAYNYAGRPVEAYELSRASFDKGGLLDYRDFYDLGCRGSNLGRFEEALFHVLLSFNCAPSLTASCFRQAFLDSELAAVWHYASSRIPDLPLAIETYRGDWRQHVALNQSPEPERIVTHSDLRQIPEEFHSLLKPRCASTLATPPLFAVQQPELHRRYLDWQATVAAPRVQAYARYQELCEQELVAAQPLFARFQATKGRFGCARSHLICILRRSLDANPDRLPEIPQLAPLLAEFRVQYEESPEAFRFLIQRSREVSEEVLNDFPPVNRASGLATMLLGNHRFYSSRYLEAVEAWSACHKIWNQDEAPLLNIVFALQCADRFEEAARVLDLVPPEALNERTRSLIQKNIAKRDASHNPTGAQPAIPTPEFGGLFHEANTEFLAWIQKNSTRQQPTTVITQK